MRTKTKFKSKKLEPQHVLGSEPIASATLTIEGCRALLAEIENEQLRTMFIATVSLGLRAGELRALKWGDFSEENCASAGFEFLFDHAIGHLWILNSKDSAHPRLPVSRELVTAFRTWRSKSILESDGDWIFARPHDESALPSGWPFLIRRIRSAARSAGLAEQISWHTLRCTHANLLSDLGLSRQTVAAFMRREFTESSEQIFVAAQENIARMLLSNERRPERSPRRRKFGKQN